MASNKDLTKEALALGKELGVEVATDGLNNDGLTKLVDELRAKKTAAQSTAPQGAVRKAADADDGEGDGEGEGASPKPASSEKAPAKPALVVAKGKAVTSKRGILGPGAGVSSDDFVGGAETVARLRRAGLLASK